MQRLGWEAVQTLRKLDQLDAYAADWLLRRLTALYDAHLAQQQARQETR